MTENYFIEYLIDQLKKENFNHIISKTNKNINKYSNNFQFWNIRGIAYIKLKNPQMAISNFERAYELDRQNPAPFANIGKLLFDYNRFNHALDFYKKSYQIDNNFIQSLVGIINCSLKLGMYLQCIEYCEVAIKNFKNLKKEVFLNYIGVAYENLGDMKKAFSYYKKSIKENSNFVPALLNEANYFAATGDIEIALQKYNDILKKFPDHSEVHRRKSIIKKYKNDDDSHLKDMLNLYSTKAQFNEIIMEELGYGLSKAYEDLKDYEKSHFFFSISNKIRGKKVAYDEKFEEKQFKLISNFFDKSFKSSKLTDFSKDKSSEEIKPIFILGMPRSGSTLVEQILSSHSKVESLGEIDYFHKSLIKEINIFPNQNNLSDIQLTEQKISTIRENYINEIISNKKTNKKYITDKIPINFKYVGFILLCFPNAKIIHTERNAKDIFISILKNFFGQLQMNYAYNESDIIHYIKQYKKYIQLWNSIFVNKIYTVKYDILVNDFNLEVKKLLNYSELDFEDDCIDFNKNQNTVVTASINQVRQPIYKSSSYAFKNYEKFLKKYLDQL